MKFIWLTIYTLFSLSFVQGAEDEIKIPVGEYLEYKMGWNFIKVGKATLLRNPNTKVGDQPCMHFSMTARTFGIADKIYKVRDSVDSYTDLRLHNTLLYKKRQIEGKTNRDIKVTFDWEKKQAQYYDFGKPKNDPIPLKDGILDPLSLLYATRNHKIKIGEMVKIPATDGKKMINVEVGVVKKEKIKVPAGKYWAYKLAPGTKDLRGVFEKSPDSKIELWVSEEQPHYPLKMKSKVIVGSFKGELVKIRKSTD